MGRLSLVLADNDAEYIRNLEKYLMINYPKRFEILSFSSSDTLNAFLQNQPKVDILLMNKRMINDRTETYAAGVVLVLAEHEVEETPCGYESIRKYQHIDRLVSEIIRLYSAKSTGNCPMSGCKNTRIISVVSPSGGTGKSCIAAGCSIISSGHGLKSFYLNLEDIPSTEVFFNGDSVQSFSKVIYHLKGSSNLWLRLEASKCTDIRTGVHFFMTPENITEMDEVEEQEVIRLIKEFRSSGVYDIVFIDLPAGLDKRNSAVLRYSDNILLVLSQQGNMQIKIKEFNKGLDLLERKWKTDITGRILPVLNFFDRKERTGSAFGYEPAALIPDCSHSFHDNEHSTPVNNVSFVSSLSGIIDYIFTDKPIACITGNGGEYIA